LVTLDKLILELRVIRSVHPEIAFSKAKQNNHFRIRIVDPPANFEASPAKRYLDRGKYG
jgi:hypothetical protein